MKYKYITLIILLTSVLSACGGEDPEEEEGCWHCEGTQEAVDNFPQSSQIATEVKENSGEIEVEMCSQYSLQSKFLESENTRIFAEPGIEESSMQLVATLTEEALRNATEAFGIQLSSYIEFRASYDLKQAFYYLIFAWQPENSENVPQIYELEPNFDIPLENLPTEEEFHHEWTDNGYEQISDGYFPYLSDEIAEEYWRSLSEVEIRNAVARVAAFNGESVSLEDFTREEKVHVCILDKSNFEGIASVSSSEGLRVTNPAQMNEFNQSNNFEPYARVIEHELIHVIQNSYMPPQLSYEYGWFTEGLAEYLTDSEITLNAHSENIVQTGLNGGLWFDKYPYAAGVIYYITQTLGNGDDSILQFLERIKTELDSNPLTSDESQIFRDQFGETFIDYDGTPLEYSELESEYFERLN